MEYLYWLFKQLCHFLNITDKYLGNAWNKEDHTFTAGMVCTQVPNDLSQARPTEHTPNLQGGILVPDATRHPRYPEQTDKGF